MKALRDLRAEGSLIPIRNHAGGRGHATTYSLVITGQGAKPATMGDDNRSREEILADPRQRKFRALARKHGPVKALDMMDE